MNLVYVVKRFPRVSETFVLQEIRELVRQGEQVTICSLRRPSSDDPLHPGAEDLAARTLYFPDGAARVVRLAAAAVAAVATTPRRAASPLAWALRWTLRERDPRYLVRFAEAAYLGTRIPSDAAHVHAHFANDPATVALLLGRLRPLPCSFTGHAYEIFERRAADLGAKISEARFVAAGTEYGRDYMAAHAASADASKVVVVRNGVDFGRFTPRSREPAGVPLLLSVARLVEKKGLQTLVEACGLLADRGVEFACEVIGEGPLRRPLEQRARELGLHGRFTLVGSRAHDDVRRAYERASVFVLPCERAESGDQDTCPVVLTEAMRVGVPVVTTPVAGITEAVRDGESGLLVPPKDAHALANALERLLADAALRSRLAHGGRVVAEGFELAACVRKLRALFRGRSPDVTAEPKAA